MTQATNGATLAAVVAGSELRNVRIVRYASLAILGGYAVAACYRVGLFRKILPREINAKIENAVEKVKAYTEPIGDKARFAMARSHLVKAYGLATSGMIAAAAGVAAFCAFPLLSISIPIATALIPAILLVGIPKNLMLPAARMLCFYTSLVSAGYTLGPFGWVAQDSLGVLVLLTGCTMAGLCLPLFLTRGMVSYVVSAQVLSFALSFACVTAPAVSKPYSPFRTIKDQAAAQMILKADVNVLMTMQLISNAGITALHTLPTIYRFVSWKGTDEDLAASADPVREAVLIDASWIYVAYRLVRWCCKGIFRQILKENPGNQKQSAPDSWNVLSNRSMNVDGASGIFSGLIMVLWYVRVVSLLQKGDPTETLNTVRNVCARISPMNFLLGSS